MVGAFIKFGLDVLIRPNSVGRWLKGDYIPIDSMLEDRFVGGIQPEPWEILLHTPTIRPTPGKRTVYFTMWESTRINQESVDNLNQADVVVVPCDWNRMCFRACGVKVPIRVCHLGMDPTIYNYRQMPMTGPFTFGVAGRISHGETRKGINEAIDCWFKAFPDNPNVRLKIKCFKDDPLQAVPDDPRISLERRYLSDRQMAMWLQTLNCFIALAKGEGWGAIQHQAMMIGRPVIGPIYSGVSMFMTDANSYAVEYKLGEPPKGNFYEGLGYWAVPEEQSAIAQMQDALNCPEHAQQKGLLAMRDTQRLTNIQSNQKLLDVLKEFQII